MKFKLDENLASLGKSLLEADGHDVMTVREQALCGVNDVTLFGVCRDEGRVLITLDHDFRQTLRFPPDKSAGLVVLECRGVWGQTPHSTPRAMGSDPSQEK